MIVGGADPGAEGAVAFLDTETTRVIALVDMPMSGRELRVRELALDLQAALDGRRLGHLWIERQAPYAGAQRRIGASSAFNLGMRFASILAIAAGSGWPVEIVGAAKWKRYFNITSTRHWRLPAPAGCCRKTSAAGPRGAASAHARKRSAAPRRR